jgi:hypothetical protein
LARLRNCVLESERLDTSVIPSRRLKMKSMGTAAELQVTPHQLNYTYYFIKCIISILLVGYKV